MQGMTILMAPGEPGAAGLCWKAKRLTQSSHKLPPNSFKISHQCLCCLVGRLFFAQHPVYCHCLHFFSHKKGELQKASRTLICPHCYFHCSHCWWALVAAVSRFPWLPLPFEITTHTLDWGVNGQIKQKRQQRSHRHTHRYGINPNDASEKVKLILRPISDNSPNKGSHMRASAAGAHSADGRPQLAADDDDLMQRAAGSKKKSAQMHSA